MVSKAIIALIEWYRKYISPLKRPCCRFYPSCSRYAVDAIRKYGVPKGAYLSIRRIIKCNPFFEGGYDPVK